MENDFETIYKILELMKQYKKNFGSPLIIEISGTPNSGKSLIIGQIHRMLKRNHISHCVIYEAAQRCKIQNKLSEEFNIWTACSMICSLLEKINADRDVIICERGIFDALCWCNFHYERNCLNIDEKELFDKILTSSRFIQLISVLFVFKCSPMSAIAREYSILTHHTEGSIINEPVLTQINDSIDRVKSEYWGLFKQKEVIDTSNYLPEELERDFSQKLLRNLVELNGQ